MKLKPPFQLNVPMVLTWARIAMIPLVMGVFYLPDSFLPLLWQNIIACVIFVIAAVTDALDGYLARRYEGWATRMGAFLDPIADKLLVSAALGFARRTRPLRHGRCNDHHRARNRRDGSARMDGQDRRIGPRESELVRQVEDDRADGRNPCLLWYEPVFGIDVGFIGTILIWIAAILTIYSMYVYMRAAGPYFDETRLIRKEHRARRHEHVHARTQTDAADDGALQG